MADVEIKKLSGNCGDPVPNCTVISIRNFETLDICLTTPVGAFPLPECNADKAILVKAEGTHWLLMWVGHSLRRQLIYHQKQVLLQRHQQNK